MNQLTLLFAILPYAERLNKGLATTERLLADPDVKDLIAVLEEVTALVIKTQKQAASEGSPQA